MPLNNNDWDKWSKHILSELTRLADCYEGLQERVNTVREDIAGLKVKAGIWGLIGGAIPVIVGLGIWILGS